jgi:hypothetical protein
LFIDTAQMLIEARDDVGARHSIRMAALHFKAAVQSVNELAALKAGNERLSAEFHGLAKRSPQRIFCQGCERLSRHAQRRRRCCAAAAQAGGKRRFCQFCQFPK